MKIKTNDSKTSNTKEKSTAKKILPVLLGNTLEAYDFCLYGVLAVYFSKIFFPASEGSLFFSLLLFSIAYISRPLGSVLWGHIADRYGRKPVLMSTLTLMAIPAIGMAIMPSYESIGIAATIIIIILRLLQGIAYGGEFPTIIVTLYELAPSNKKGLYGSFADGFAITGYLAALLFVGILNKFLTVDQMSLYGWRILFLISIVFIAIVSYIRCKLTETLIFENSSNRPFLVSMKTDYLNLVKIVLYMAAPNALFFNFIFHNQILFFYSENSYAIFIQASIVFFSIFMLALMGNFSDKVNRIKLMKINYSLIFILSIPLYHCFSSGNLFLVFLAYFVFSFFVCLSVGTFPAIIVAQANPLCRVSTIGISHSLAVIFGSFIPSINELVKKITLSEIAPAYVIMLACCLSFFMLFKLKIYEEKNEKI